MAPRAGGQDPEGQAHQVLCRHWRNRAVQPHCPSQDAPKGRGPAVPQAFSCSGGGVEEGGAPWGPPPRTDCHFRVQARPGLRLFAHRPPHLRPPLHSERASRRPHSRHRPLTFCSLSRTGPEHAFRPRVHACLPLTASETNPVYFLSFPHVTSVTPRVNTPPFKECFQSSRTEGVFPERPDHPQQTYHSKGLFSIPEVAEDGEQLWFLHKQGLGYSARARARARSGDEAPPASWLPAKPRGPGVGPHAEDFVPEDRGCRFGRSASRSPDSGLDCGSDEEELHFSFRNVAKCSPGPGHCRCRRSLRPLLARRRTLTRQSSIEEDFGEQAVPGDALRSDGAPPSPERATPRRSGWEEPLAHQGLRDVFKKSVKVPDSRATGRQAQPRPGPAEGPLVCEVRFLLTSACQANPFPFSPPVDLCW